jgi:hypothetical protein
MIHSAIVMVNSTVAVTAWTVSFFDIADHMIMIIPADSSSTFQPTSDTVTTPSCGVILAGRAPARNKAEKRGGVLR